MTDDLSAADHDDVIADIAQALVDKGDFAGLSDAQQKNYLARAARIAPRVEAVFARRATSSPPADPPTTVIQAIHAVMRDLPGIGKDEKSEQGYQYRGIEQITRHVQALFGKYGVTMIPEVQERRVKEFSINSRPWTEDELHVVYRAYGPAHGTVRSRRVLSDDGSTVLEVDEVVQDMVTIGPLIGLGRDNSDKGANKSMTQCLKYALIQTLCIGDGKDDADRDEARVADPPPPPGWAERERLRTSIQSGGRPLRDDFRDWVAEQGFPAKVHEFNDTQLDAAEGWLMARRAAEAERKEALVRLAKAGVTPELLTKPSGTFTDEEADLINDLLHGPDADHLRWWIDSLEPPAQRVTGSAPEPVATEPAISEAGEASQEPLLGSEPSDASTDYPDGEEPF